MKKYTTLLLLIFIIIFINQFPNYFASTKIPQGYVYSGQASWFDPWDINVYISALRQGQKGNVLLSNTYSTSKTNPAFIYPVYLGIGNIFRFVPVYTLFHISAIVFAVILCIGIFYCSLLLLRSVRLAYLALFLIAIGGGLGWISRESYKLADLYMTSFTFSSALQRPHEAIGTLLYVIAFSSYLLTVLDNRKKYFSVISIICLLFLIIFYPYYLLNFILISGIFALILPNEKRKSALTQLFFSVGICLPFTIVYYVHLLQSGFSSVSQQFLDLLEGGSVSIIQKCGGYGVLIVFFIYQFIRIKQHEYKKIFLSLWIVISLILSFFPFGINRFFMRGLFFPLIILFCMNLDMFSKVFHTKKNILIVIMVILVSLSSWYMLYKRIAEAGKKNPWFYISSDMNKSFEFLRAQNKNGVLAPYYYGNYIPAKTDKHTYIGHIIQTPNISQKITRSINFYTGRMDKNEAMQFLKENNISYIVYTIKELELKKTYPFLKRIYKNSAVEIYE